MSRPFLIFAAAFLAAFLLFGCASGDNVPASIASSQVAIDTYLASEARIKENARQTEAEQRKVTPATLEEMEENEPRAVVTALSSAPRRTF